jgi:hypothetical protein
MKARDSYIQAVLNEWRVGANALQNPSLQNLREGGKRCASCEAKLPPPNTPGFRQCPGCRRADAHAIYMVFAYRNSSWHCRFLDEGPEGTLVNEVTFGSPDTVLESARRGKALTFAAAKRRTDCVLAERREGKLWLQLTVPQYVNLQRHRPGEIPCTVQLKSSE